MEEKNTPENRPASGSNDGEKQATRRYRVISRTLFLDVLFNKQTRPIFIYGAAVITVGAALYHWLEGWDWLDSFYFVVVTLTTIGYGDLYPTTPAAKVLTIFYGLNGVIILLLLFDVIRTLRGWQIVSPGSGPQEQELEGED